MNHYKERVNFSSSAEAAVLREIRAIAAAQHLDFTEMLHKLFMDEINRSSHQIRVLQNA